MKRRHAQWFAAKDHAIGKKAKRQTARRARYFLRRENILNASSWSDQTRQQR